MAIFTYHLLPATTALALLLNSPTSALPSPPPPESQLEARGTGIAPVLAATAANLFKGVFGKSAQCCYNDPFCRVVESDDGKWQGCFDSPPDNGGYLFTQDDSTTAACLINLHYTQPTTCISVAGSPCEAGKGTSQILNARMGGNWKLSGQDSLVLQAAANGMAGQTVSSGYSDNAGRSSGVVDLVRVGQNVAESGVTIRFDGDQYC